MSTDKSSQPHHNRAVAKSASIIGFATFCSRILGFIRDIVIARLFGVYIYAQAFVIAFRIPNLFRDLLGEGAANAAFVPVFTEYSLKHTKEEFWELANIVLNVLLVILSLLTLFGIIFAPLIVRIIAPGFVGSAEKLSVTITLSRIIFPYVILICLSAYAMGLLNTLRHFSVPAFAPCLLNISIIVCALMLGEGITGLAAGVLIGGLLQLGIQIPVLIKKGFSWKPVLKFKHPEVKTIGGLLMPRVLSSSIYQLNNFVDSIFGSLAWIVGEGGVAVLYFSYRLIQFPIGIFSNALSQAILPTFSAQALEDEHAKLKHTLSWGLRTTFFVMLPASAGFMVLALPIISGLFGGGRFDAYSAKMTASALFFYSVGLFAYGSTKVLQSCFFSLKDTITPTKNAFLVLILNIIFVPILMFPLKIGGIALATSISGIIGFIVLGLRLKKKIGDFGTKEIVLSFLKILVASCCMGVVCYIFSKRGAFPSTHVLSRFINLGAVIFISAVSYIAFCFIFRVSEMRSLLLWVLKRERI